MKIGNSKNIIDSLKMIDIDITDGDYILGVINLLKEKIELLKQLKENKKIYEKDM